MKGNFKTVYQAATAEIIEKKSRFIGAAAPVDTEGAAADFVDSIRKAHPRANHNCFAYIGGDAPHWQKQSDDGEPSGTAGMPMFEILRGEGLLNVCVVVTRYFGGTLLGKGGLHRAYSAAAKAALLEAGIVEKIVHARLEIRLDYHLAGKMAHELATGGYHTENTDYAENVAITILTPPEKIPEINRMVADATSGTGKIIHIKDLHCVILGEGGAYAHKNPGFSAGAGDIGKRKYICYD
ncbi:MAG: IMPACT family protein [Defluviitaleaceae bacterium]|nr:IMPACT family protein [Defluviitaleaceae bacterium]